MAAPPHWAITTHKGGTGKSKLIELIAAAAAENGDSVLVVDVDMSQKAVSKLIAKLEAAVGRGCIMRCSTNSGPRGQVDWASAIVDAATGRAKGGAVRPKSGRPWQEGQQTPRASDAAVLPLVVAISAAKAHDSQALKPLPAALPAIRSRRGPRRRQPVKVRADNAYNSAEHPAWLRRPGSCHASPCTRRIERGPGPPPLEDRTDPGLAYRRLTVRYATPRPPVQRLPRPRRRHHLLHEARRIAHVRHDGAGARAQPPAPLVFSPSQSRPAWRLHAFLRSRCPMCYWNEANSPCPLSVRRACDGALGGDLPRLRHR
uniref:nucleotide-binding protein n=1 Tax=Actinomadura sp. CA-154981 TaxID=3240037 RepID=UPI003F493D65